MSLYLLAVSYAAMAVAGSCRRRLPAPRSGPDQSPRHRLRNPADWNYTTFLDIAFLFADGSAGLALHHHRRSRNAEVTRPPAQPGASWSKTGVRDEHRSGLRINESNSAVLPTTSARPPVARPSRAIRPGTRFGNRHWSVKQPTADIRPLVAKETYGKHSDGDGSVCGMMVNTRTAEYRSFRGGDTYYFCSAGCKEEFDKDPDKYLARNEGGHPAH